MKNKALTERLSLVLEKELGWNCHVDGDGDVSFDSTYGFRVWLASHDHGDPEYLRMHTGFGLARFLEQAGCPLDLSRMDVQLRLLKGAARLTDELKGVKVTISTDDSLALFSVEIVAAGPGRLPSVEHLAAIMPRMHTMLVAGVRAFHEVLVIAGLENQASLS